MVGDHGPQLARLGRGPLALRVPVPQEGHKVAAWRTSAVPVGEFPA